MPNSALLPFSAALYGVLNVPSLTAPPPLGAGARSIVEVPPEAVGAGTFPFVWYEIARETNISGLGRGPWLLELEVRIHAFSVQQSMEEAQRIIEEAIRLLRAAQLTPAGWHAWYLPNDDQTLLPFELLAGEPVRELVTGWRAYVEES
jgi:hypothetical protein